MAINVPSSGLLQLVRDVRAYFELHAADGATATVTAAGWKERHKQLNQGPGRANRVVFIPSRQNGGGGKIEAAHQPGPRDLVGQDLDGNEIVVARTKSIGDWKRDITISIWAADTDRKNDEEAQIEAVETLFEWVKRAQQNVSPRGLIMGAVNWNVDGAELTFGKEILVDATYSHPLFAKPQEVVYPTVAINKPTTLTPAAPLET